MTIRKIAGLLARLRPPKRLGIVIAVIAALLIAGAIYQNLSSAADERANPPPGTLVDMGGFRLHLYCTGQGAPTVVLIGGAGDFWAIWDPIQQSIGQSTRVCTYDRPGLGSSDSHPVMSPTVDAHVTMLRQLLLNAEEQGPYVVVGHSIGGLIARKFAGNYPQETVGVVLVDSSVEGQFMALPSSIIESNQSAGIIYSVCQVLAPVGIVRLLGLGDARAGAFPVLSERAQAAVAAAFHQTRGCTALRAEGAMADEPLTKGGPPVQLGDIPLIVITGNLVDVEQNPSLQWMQDIWLDIQAGLLQRSTNSTWVIAERSSHYVHTDNPELVIDAIQSLLSGN